MFEGPVEAEGAEDGIAVGKSAWLVEERKDPTADLVRTQFHSLAVAFVVVLLGLGISVGFAHKCRNDQDLREVGIEGLGEIIGND